MKTSKKPARKFPVVCAVVAAGGAGVRFRKKDPLKRDKLYIESDGLPLIAITLKPLLESPLIKRVVVVYRRRGKIIDFADVLDKFDVFGKLEIVCGGKTRAESVKAGVEFIGSSADYILIHDGNRPFLTEEMIERTVFAAMKNSAAILARRATETVKVGFKDLTVSGTLRRESLYIAETPQVFRADILKAAYKAAGGRFSDAPDEASLVEKIGVNVKIVENENPNPKITVPEDYYRWFPPKERGFFIGLGYDIHPLAPGRGLKLGGVKVKCDLKLVGHSDADAVLHSLSDAIFTALGLRDIGVYFPPGSLMTKGMDSRKIFKSALTALTEKGFIVNNASIVIALEKPRITRYIPRIIKSIKEMLGKDSSAVVGISAKSAEDLGVIGSSEAIAVLAAVTLLKLPD
ncbi:MAG: bifunctional 2-C-methyl-D-erythritol 4-phosphate cytidylyltransferase/2-C-methyl-D-erythritol 2,4-cyclodiphosphate synthase [Myxococcota bacterium]